MLERLGRVAVDVAAVQEHDRALVDVVRHLGDELRQLEEAVLVGQRELVGRQEGDGVLAHRAEHLLHRGERAERVAVGMLVRGEHEALAVAQRRRARAARDGRDAVAGAHASPASRGRSARAIRMPRSVGVVVDELERRRVLEPQLARDRALEHAVRRLRGPAASACARPASPSTETKTRARRRSGAVSTAVTVTNPTRGSLTCCGDRVGEDLADGLVHPAHAVGGHPSASRSLHEARRRSTRTPCGKRASSARAIASAASSQRPAEPPASATASVERCQESWWRDLGHRRAHPLAQMRLDAVELRALGLQRTARPGRRGGPAGGRRTCRTRRRPTRACARPAACRRPRSRRPPSRRRSSCSTMPHSKPDGDLAHVVLQPRRSDSIVAVVDDRAVAHEPAACAPRVTLPSMT